MAYIETYNANYYGHKIGSLLFGCLFFFGGLLTLINEGTIEINGVPTKATLANTSPFLIIGGAFIVLFIWIIFNYYRVILTDYNIQKQLLNGSNNYDWEDMEELSEVTWLWRGTFYKFKPKGERAFYIHVDKPKVSFQNPFNTGWNNPTIFKSKMAELINSKKHQLKI